MHRHGRVTLPTIAGPKITADFTDHRPHSGAFSWPPSARPLQPILIGRKRLIKRRPGAQEILGHRGPWPRPATQQPGLQLGTLLSCQQVVDRIEHHGIRPSQPIRPPAATVIPTSTTRGQCHSQAVEHPQPPPDRKPPAVAGPNLLPVEGLVNSDLPGLNRHGTRHHGNQSRCHCIPAGWWRALRSGVRWVWRSPGGAGPACSAGALGVRCWAQFSIHIQTR